MGRLQEIINDNNFKCNILNYTNNKIYVDCFYYEERYFDFLNGKNCKGGQGLFNIDEELEFNKLKDYTLVIIQHDGIETVKYKYVPIFKATMEYKDIDTNNKKVNKTLTFSIRKNVYDGKVNFIAEFEGTSLDFNSVQDVKKYLNEKYGVYKLTEWSVVIG